KIFFKEKNSFLDYAGGYGIFTRLMKNKGFNFYWDDKYTENTFSKGFEYKKQKIDLTTCFECFEHFEEPIKEIEKILKISNNIIFSTRLIPKEIPEKNWVYYGFNHGQHIAFYSKKTLFFIAKNII
ncbi:MAG: class I SAM-dependent methyltransferase, partial [Candidatus ainarchaeum sp.]|nr:class I SAM-dependent methyltransferase [Candidatus ainarchaeum sp.]